MDIWAQRGKLLLTIALVALGVSFLLERLIYHAVTGFDTILFSLGTGLILAGLGYLITCGRNWPRWVIGLFLILNSLGGPVGLVDVLGSFSAMLIVLYLPLINFSTAVLLCFAPGIPAYLRYRRAQLSSARTQRA